MSDSQLSVVSEFQLPESSISIKIPPRPALLMALQRELRQENYNTKKIAELINRDVAMAGRMIETTNSAFFNMSRRASSVQDAIAMIGMSHCSAIMSGFITRKELGVGAMMMARFWDVSEKRAKGMSFVAEETRAVQPEVAYNFGLFCDIGIPLLRAAFPTYLHTLSIANTKASEEFLKVEQDQHGVNHAFIGSVLAEQWLISPEVVLAIKMHHSREVLRDESITNATRSLVALNLVVEKAIEEHRGKPESLEWIESGAIASEVLELAPADVDAMCEALKIRFRA